MKRKFALAAALAAVMFLAASALAAEMHQDVKVLSKQEIGNYLADKNGMTLYWFKNDSVGKSACMGGCVARWPVYFHETVGTEGMAMLMGSDFGMITREDGAKQTTFRGYPLYYFADDKAAGDTKGAGLNGVWFVVDPDKFPPK